MFTQYLTELLAVISITILTIVTPGPDFVVVAKNSLTYSRRSGVLTAIGVASAVWIHIFYREVPWCRISDFSRCKLY